jgi:3-hydroxymyristoyl/3-hydroxydecanoyl-(acyl carrier protein) dehydratase
MTSTDLSAQLRDQFTSNHWPRIETCELSEQDVSNPAVNPQECRLQLYIAEDMHWLTGHFPQQPVVAGVVQTHWAGEIAKYVFRLSDDFVRIDNLKFQQVILPAQSLSLKLQYAPATEPAKPSAVKFCYSKGERIFSEGKLIFQSQWTESADLIAAT